MMDTYTPDEFMASAKLRGYAIGAKQNLDTWMAKHPKAVYTDEDFEQLYRDTYLAKWHGGHSSLWADGQGGSEPQHMGNSYQPRQETILQQEIIHNQNYERKLKERMMKK